MTLQERLDAYTAQFRAQAPPEVQAIMHRVTEDLRRSGILERTLNVGDRAPEFALPSARGEIVRSKDLLAMPGRFIIDQDSIIRAAEVNPDYTVRPEPRQTVEALSALLS